MIDQITWWMQIVLIRLANRHSRWYWAWHLGPFKWWVLYARDPIKHLQRGGAGNRRMALRRWGLIR